MNESLPVLLTIEILDYEKKGQTVYYSIEIMANATKTWTIARKFKDIEEMHKKLMKKLSNMPYLPAKSIFSLGEDDYDKRKDDLEKYLNVLASRKDTLSDPEFKNFLELESHVKTETLTVVKELYEIPNLPMGVKDFVYIPSKGVLFVLLAETRIVSKIGSFLSSISKSQEVSSIIAYKEDPQGSLEFTKLWQYNLSNEGCMLTWDHGLTILAIGHVNGLIECIRVSTELEYSRYTSFCKVHCHTQTITGIILLPETGHLLSSSLDKYLVKTDIANNEAHLAEKEHPQALTTMIMDKANGRFFVADSAGTVFIYSAEGQMRNLATIAYHQENFIKTLFFDKQRSLLVAGSNQGNIVVYDIGKPGREKFSTYTTSFETVKQIRGLHFVGKNKELYVATASGTIAFMNSLTTIAFHMLDAHSGEVCKMVYFENDKLMVTGSSDRSIKFWRYPFDPNEKIQPKKIHAPKMPTYDYPDLKSNSTKAKAQSDEESGSASEEEERDSREALTLFQYRPAKEPVFEDSEDDAEENFNEALAKADKKRAEQVKEEEPVSDEDLPKEEKKKAPKIRKRPEHPLAIAEPEEDSDEEVPQKHAEASPKSFLFKNSVIEVVSKKDIRDLEKKAKVGGKPKEEKEKEPEAKAPKTETDDPLSRSLKPAPKQVSKKATENSTIKKQDKQETEVKPKVEGEKEVKKVEEKEEVKKEEEGPEKSSEKEKKEEPAAVEDSKEKPSTSSPKVEEKEKSEKKQEKPPKKEEEKTSTSQKEEKKVADKKLSAPQAKVIDDPLSYTGPLIKKKTSAQTTKPKTQQKSNVNDKRNQEPDSNILQIPTQPAKKKVVRKSLMDSDSDDDNLLDFQGLRKNAQTKSSKVSTKKKQQESDEDEGLAGWAQ